VDRGGRVYRPPQFLPPSFWVRSEPARRTLWRRALDVVRRRDWARV